MNMVQISNIPLERLWNIGIKSGFDLSIWSYEVKVMVKKKLKIRFLTIKTWKTKVKWPLIETCNIPLFYFFWKIHLCGSKNFSIKVCEKIMSL